MKIRRMPISNLSVEAYGFGSPSPVKNLKAARGFETVESLQIEIKTLTVR
jgi:hypothetical protein